MNNPKPQIAVIHPNSLCCLAMRTILQDIAPFMGVSHDVDIATYNSMEQMEQDEPMMIIHYFVAAEVVRQNMPFFAPQLRRCIILGEGDEQGSVASEVCLRRHGHGGIGDAVGDLRQGVARAGGNYHSIKGCFGAEGLGCLNGVDYLPAAEGLDAFYKVLCPAEACVGGVGSLAHYGLKLHTPRKENFHLRNRLCKGTERACQGVAYHSLTSISRKRRMPSA